MTPSAIPPYAICAGRHQSGFGYSKKGCHSEPERTEGDPDTSEQALRLGVYPERSRRVPQNELNFRFVRDSNSNVARGKLKFKM